MSKFDKIKRDFPKLFNPNNNTFWSAILQAIADSDENIVTQLDNTKAQIFVRTASGKYLDLLAGDYGVERPSILGMQDSDFQELIPNLSIKPKQIRKAVYDTLRVFWGDLFQKANLESINAEPFTIAVGETITVSRDGATAQEIKILAGDLQTPGAAMAAELISIFNDQFQGITAEVISDPVGGTETINLRTDTPGATGSIEVTGGTMIDPAKLDFDTSKTYRVTDLNQRTVVYEIRDKELIIEIPAIIPTLRRTLKGSHHLHADGTLESAVPPANGIWHGSFLFDPNNSPFTIDQIRCKLQDPIVAGTVQTMLGTTVGDNASEFENSEGWLIFDFGKTTEEYPVKYLSKANDRTLILDPAHVFAQDHAANSYVNFLSSLQGHVPSIDGTDYAIYMNSPSAARLEVQALLETLAASGVTVTFVVLLPEYKYLDDSTNPYA